MNNNSMMQFSIENGNYTAIITSSSDFRPESNIDSLHRERKLSTGTSFCCIGFIRPHVDCMFSVTAWDCATGYFFFGHKIGHNVELRHECGASGACNHEKISLEES